MNPAMMAQMSGPNQGPMGGPNYMPNNNMEWNQINQMNAMNSQNGGGMMSNPTFYNGVNSMMTNEQLAQMNAAFAAGPNGMMNAVGNMMNYSSSQGDGIGSGQPFDITSLFDNPLIYNNFKLFDSATYNGRDLLFLDQTVTFMDLDDKTSYLTFLSE